jgi:hypothetical protein
MASKGITPLQLELSEGPTELVRLYVEFAGPDGALRKGRVLAWDGPGCGYTVRILGRLEQVRGVQASKMQFLANQDEVDARPVLDTGRSGVLTGAVSKHGGRAPPQEGRRQKRECPASIFVGVVPFWSSDRILYRIRVKGKTYGRFEDENQAALARDYAARRVAFLSGVRVREINLDQVFLEDTAEMARLDRWVDEVIMHVQQQSYHGVHAHQKAGGDLMYRIRLHVGRQTVQFGTYDNAEFAASVADYVSRELLRTGDLNFPSKELLGNKRLKLELQRIYAQVISEVQTSESSFADAKKEFWDSVQYGPIFTCCSCHQTWFRKSVQAVTKSMVSMLARSGAVSVITDVSRWICRTCYGYVSQGKVPAICHLHYDPFSALPEPLLDLSPIENDLIALRLPFMKLRALKAVKDLDSHACVGW